MRTSRNSFLKSSFAAFLFVIAAAVFGSRAQAQQVPGPHPAYLHALSDLRMARAYLSVHVDNPRLLQDEHRAINEINAAIAEIRKAAIDDGKDVNYNPPIDSRMDEPGRLHAAEHLLDKVHQDIGGAEDVPQARGMRDRASIHINAAWGATKDAIVTREQHRM